MMVSPGVWADSDQVTGNLPGRGPESYVVLSLGWHCSLNPTRTSGLAVFPGTAQAGRCRMGCGKADSVDGGTRVMSLAA
jgi:hypothetical protein